MELKDFAISTLQPVEMATLKMPWDGEREIKAEKKGNINRNELHGYAAPHIKRTAADLRPLNRGAIEHMANLPPEGHSYHYLICDKVTLWDVVPAIIDKLNQSITKLSISTLTFGPATANDLITLIDIDKIKRVDFLVSSVFKAKNGQLYDSLIPHLLQRNQRAAAMRTHAKIVAFEMDEGRQFVIESSSNLRSSKSVEQVAIVADRGLYAFHAGWISGALDQEFAGKQPQDTEQEDHGKA